jgi:hypothetical protein
MNLKENIRKSRELEIDIFVGQMKSIYEESLKENEALYDITYNATQGFKAINSATILSDSRVIKILRYSVSPTISQMKFGQMFEMTSIEPFEREKHEIGSEKYECLKAVAGKIADFINKNIDEERFWWREKTGTPSSNELALVKKWTCSIAADQNAQTEYRRYRKQLQEKSVAVKLESLGYTLSGFHGVITSINDLKPGEYTLETKVKGRTTQKADLAFRSKSSNRLVLVEAKAVGVEIDATKRIKECCDKANDWTSRSTLGAPILVAVIAGFFTEKNISNLRASKVLVAWEHDLHAIDAIA